MNLRQAAEQALEKLEFFAHMKSVSEDTRRLITALRQALAQTEQEPVTLLPDGSAFGVMSFPLPESHWLYAEREYRDGEHEPIELGKPILTHELRNAVVSAMRYAIRGATNLGKEMDFDPDALVQNAVYALCGPYTPHVDAVNISQERVDETAKREHEPWPSVQCVCGGTIYFKYTPPISDYHEGWEEGFKAATREHEPFIYVREDNERPFGGYEHCSEADAGAFPVYTAPPKKEWLGLTEDDVHDAFNYVEMVKLLDFDRDRPEWCEAFASACEARLRHKNGGNK